MMSGWLKSRWDWKRILLAILPWHWNERLYYTVLAGIALWYVVSSGISHHDGMTDQIISTNRTAIQEITQSNNEALVKANRTAIQEITQSNNEALVKANRTAIQEITQSNNEALVKANRTAIQEITQSNNEALVKAISDLTTTLVEKSESDKGEILAAVYNESDLSEYAVVAKDSEDWQSFVSFMSDAHLIGDPSNINSNLLLGFGNNLDGQKWRFGLLEAGFQKSPISATLTPGVPSYDLLWTGIEAELPNFLYHKGEPVKIAFTTK